jgi:hypothetical protein
MGVEEDRYKSEWAGMTDGWKRALPSAFTKSQCPRYSPQRVGKQIVAKNVVGCRRKRESSLIVVLTLQTRYMSAGGCEAVQERWSEVEGSSRYGGGSGCWWGDSAARWSPRRMPRT